jgi:hypothetical protein
MIGVFALFVHGEGPGLKALVGSSAYGLLSQPLVCLPLHRAERTKITCYLKLGDLVLE